MRNILVDGLRIVLGFGMVAYPFVYPEKQKGNFIFKKIEKSRILMKTQASQDVYSTASKRTNTEEKTVIP